jgi:uncharacterized membrane protein YcjF (UPF0283 family)
LGEVEKIVAWDITGAIIGGAIGLVAGIIGVILINAVFDPKSDVKPLLSIGGALIPIVATLYGADWIRDTMKRSEWLIPAACIAFLLTILYPATRVVLRVGHNVGRGSQT